MDSTAKITLEFRGTVRQTALWVVLSLLGGPLILPLAWIHAAMARWLCRSTAFSDGATAEFRGSAGDVVVWHVFLFIVLVGQQLLLGQEDETGVLAPVLLVTLLAVLAIVLTLIKWFVHNVRITPGPQLTFSGSFLALAGWYLLLLLSLATIVGWAWVAVSMYRWMARHVRGQGVAFEFRASGLEFLWRSVVFLLWSSLLVTIPWAALWFLRWLLSNVVLIRGVETSFEDLMHRRTPPRPSSRASAAE